MNCKPGDMAIIVECDIKEVIGVVVEVMRAAGYNPGSNVFEWFVRPTRPIQCFVSSGLLALRAEMGCPDAWLRPVSGLPVDDEVTDDLEITA